MRAPDGYTIRKPLVDLPRKFVCVALRESDRAEVVLKGYPSTGSDPNPTARARREFDALRTLSPGVAPVALALEENDGTPVLVLQPVSGSVPRGPLCVQAFLDVAIETSRALTQIHRAHIVHRGLAPTKLRFDEATGELRITGFGRCAPLGAPAESEESFGRTGVNALFYVSPEQTGRLHRGVDFRSDLYSLGATFYELLSGRPPFDARDPRDLIHAHIGRRPRSPSELQDGIPGTLARITMRLLEKEPEDRYQTAEALTVDLETCREQLQRTGRIDDELPLGSSDAPYRPLFRQRIYGREPECRTLQQAYANVSQGRSRLVLVLGAPGIGKSALIPELYRPLALDGGYLARGKFDLYRGHLPYAGVASALRSLLRQIASESEERQTLWRQALQESLGSLCGALAQLLPELCPLLGPLPEAPPLDPAATKARLALAVRRLVNTAARQANPLVLFLDDLQWADAGSRYLLEELLLAPDTAPLLVIGAYRDNEVDAKHPLSSLRDRLIEREVSVDSMLLGPLSRSALLDLLVDVFDQAAEQVEPLATCIQNHSRGNPLLVQQYVYHLHELGHIRYERGRGWTWDLMAITASTTPADPVGMMLTRLQRLGGECRAIIQLASCVGDEFDVSLLAELSQRDRAALEAAIYELSDEGLIAPCREGFRFVHDRIREAAQELVPACERERLHYRTANLLLERLSEAEQNDRVFEIADHLARATTQIPAHELRRAVGFQRSAGFAASRSGAVATAGHYFDAAMQLLEASPERDVPGLAFELRFRSAVCAYFCRNFDRALSLLEGLERTDLSLAQRAFAAALRIKISDTSRPVPETLELLFETLERFGAPFPRSPSRLRARFEVARVSWMLRGDPESWTVFPAPQGGDPSARFALLFRMSAGRALAYASPALISLAPAIDLRHSLRCGFTQPAALLLTVFAAMRRMLLWSSRGLERYIRATRLLQPQTPEPTLQYGLELLLWQTLIPWISERRAALEPLRAAAERLEELGNIAMTRGARRWRAIYAALSGVNLEAALTYFQAIPALEMDTEVERPSTFTHPYRWLMDSCSPGPEVSEALAQIDAHADTANILAPHWMLALSVAGDFERAWWVSERVRHVILERNARPTHVTDFLMFRGLAAAVLAREARGRRRWSLLLHARACERRLAVAARYGPDFVHMAEMIRAERCWSRRFHERGLERYERVARRAEAQGYVHHAAIAYERMGTLRAEVSPTDAPSAEIDRARELYTTWGATAKARRLGA